MPAKCLQNACNCLQSACKIQKWQVCAPTARRGGSGQWRTALRFSRKSHRLLLSRRQISSKSHRRFQSHRRISAQCHRLVSFRPIIFCPTVRFPSIKSHLSFVPSSEFHRIQSSLSADHFPRAGWVCVSVSSIPHRAMARRADKACRDCGPDLAILRYHAPLLLAPVAEQRRQLLELQLLELQL